MSQQDQGQSENEAEPLLPFSTGLPFSRRISSKAVAFPLTTGLFSLVLAGAHIWFGDSSGLMLCVVTLLLLLFCVTPTTFGLNIICFISAVYAVQSITSFLGTLSTNSFLWTQILPDGKALVILYGFGFVLSIIIFLWSFRLLYAFDPWTSLTLQRTNETTGAVPSRASSSNEDEEYVIGSQMEASSLNSGWGREQNEVE